METLLVDCVQSSLRLFMHRNAIFLCERLCAEFPSEINLQLLASCYLYNNQAYCAYHILKGMQMAQSRYLFAMSCYQMNLLLEAQLALCPANEPNAEVPNGAAGHYLLGLIYRCTDRRKSAVDHFMLALSIDPFLWDAYKELCILGAAEEANVTFGDSIAVRLQQQHMPSELSSLNLQINNEDRLISSNRAIGTGDVGARQPKLSYGNHLKDIPANSHGVVTAGAGTQSANCGHNLSHYNTPSPLITQLSGAVPPPLHRGAVVGEGSPKSTVNAAVQLQRRKVLDEGKLRKSFRTSSARGAYSQVSGRLFPDSGPRRSTRLAGDAPSVAIFSSHATGNGSSHSYTKLSGGFSSSSKHNSTTIRSMVGRKGHTWAAENLDEGRQLEPSEDSRFDNTVSSSFSSVDECLLERERTNMQASSISMLGPKVKSGALELLSLFRILGEGFRLSCMYRCQDALEVYLKLPHEQYNTGWVLSQVGKAYFELVDYYEADHAFSLARCASPCNLEGMDIYSTVLYHLKEELKLSHLAQELIATDRLSPQAWCAVGNCFSLQKDHETSLKNFQRAVQLDPRFAYAHTLCGHEYVALEDYDNGIKCYQSALQIDARHYNAWYGLGMIYLTQEKFAFAEHHFHKAFHINPRSSVILCYLGIALHALKRNGEALKMMDKAIVADKKNPLPMYHKANILLSLERYDEALKDLEQLKDYAPRESSVWALMGKIFKRLGMHEKAMFHFGIALDLKPSAADIATIKSAIEKLHVPEEIEDNL